MIVNRYRGIRNIVGVVETSAAFSLYWLFYFFFEKFSIRGALGSKHNYFVYSMAVVAGLALYFLRNNKTDWPSSDDTTTMVNVRQSFKQTVYAAFSLFIMMATLKETILSRIFLFSYLPLLFWMLTILNGRLPHLACRLFFKKGRRLKTLLIGPSKKSLRLRPWLDQMRNYGLEPVGLISDEITGDKVGDLAVLGGMDDIKRIVVEEKISYIVLLQIPRVSNMLGYLIELTEKYGIRMMVLNDLSDIFKCPLNYNSQGGFDFITMRDEPLEDPLNRLVKRILDICIALPVVLFILPPLCAMAWLMQRLQSPGPLFYQQSRGGLKNESFTIYKLRTMHPANSAAAVQATRDDPRVYPFGRFLRRNSLDEFPQFINVIMGEMSVVGPRPHMIEHNEIFARAMQNYNTRTYIKPGLTGLAQVLGHRGESKEIQDIISRVQSDIQYVENWSLILDLKLIYRTVFLLIIPQDSAY